MKKILTFLLILVSTNLIAQNRDWQDEITRKFYSKIDSSRSFNCCDKVGNKATNCISIEYTFPTYQLPYNSTQGVFENYYTDVVDSLIIDVIVEDLVDCYNKIPKKLRSKFTKTCFGINTETKIEHGYKSDLFFVGGEIHFVFNFQMDKPHKRNIFMKLKDLVNGN